MNFPKLSFEWETAVHDFIEFWSAFYNYPKEHLYSERIQKSEFRDDDIEKFFEWKNGTPLSQKKKASLKRISDKIHIINRLKADFDIETFEKEFHSIAAIWKIYLLHLIVPQTYPIFDQHVCRAFYLLTENKLKEIPITNKSKEILYFRHYVGFFSSLANGRILRKKIDEALWAFGKFLKTEYGKKVVSLSTKTGTNGRLKT